MDSECGRLLSTGVNEFEPRSESTVRATYHGLAHANFHIQPDPISLRIELN